jgi:hypothetical protein
VKEKGERRKEKECFLLPFSFFLSPVPLFPFFMEEKNEKTQFGQTH